MPVDSKKTVEKLSNRIQKSIVSFAALMLLMSTSLGFIGGWLGAKSQLRNAGISGSGQTEIITTESRVINRIAEEVGESVVSVDVTRSTQTQDSIFGPGQTLRQSGAGTGFIIREDGIVVTNRHVVPEGTDEVSVTLSDGTRLEQVEVIGRTGANDPLDVAFLRIKDTEGRDLKAVKLGRSGDVKVGDKAIAIGNALGQFQNSVTAGIISGFGRDVEASDGSGTSSDRLQNLIQTDAAINQGNSGGPLVNINGEVIGINTAVAGGGAENIGFAIPIDDVKGVIEGVLTDGKVVRPYLGVRYLALNDELAKELELSVSQGAYVLTEEESRQPGVVPGSPASKAGIEEGDVITKVGEDNVDNRNSLTSLIGRHKVGEEVTLTVVRDGQQQEIRVTLEALPTE